MGEGLSFVKVIVEEETGRILGCTVVGSSAPELVQQVTYLMNTDYQDLMPMIKAQVIHPTISEVVVQAFSNLEHPYHEAGRMNEKKSQRTVQATEEKVKEEAGSLSVRKDEKKEHEPDKNKTR
jgi:hypothetical protein